MLAYLLRRMAGSAFIILAVSFIAFLALFEIGDPVDVLLPETATTQQRDEVRQQWGLDKPVWEQYISFLSRAVVGDFGNSFVYSEPAIDVILSRFPATAELALLAFVLIVVLGLPLGVVAGMRPNGVVSRVVSSIAVVLLSLPSFWVAIMLILFFAVRLGWLPATGRGETQSVLGVQLSIITWDGFRHAILPALNLALPNAALVFRLVRASVMEAKLGDYVRFAQSKGLSPFRIVWVHILSNVMLPVVTVLGLELGGILAFAVVTETIFAWPGVGRLLIDAISLLDRPLVVTYLMFVVCLIILINLSVDILYAILDPRVRAAR